MPTPLTRERLILNRPLGYWLFNEEFTPTASAGTLTQYVSETMTWTALDTNNKLSIAGGALTGVTGGAANFDPSLVGRVAVVRSPGRTMVASVNVSANRMIVGWMSQPTINTSLISTSRRGTIDFNATSLAIAQTGTGSIPVASFALSTSYQVAIVMRDNGCQYYTKGGAFSYWTLLWIDTGVVNALGYPLVTMLGTTTAFTCDYIRCRNSRFIASPVASDGFGDSFGETDGLGHNEGVSGGIGIGGGGLTWTQLGTWGSSGGATSCSALSGGVGTVRTNTGKPSAIVTSKVTRAGGEAGLLLRYADGNNFVSCRHNGTNVTLIKKVATVNTTLVNAAATYVAGAELRVIMDGKKFRVYYNNALVGTEQTISDAALQTSGEHGLYTTSTSNTFDDFVVYARGTDSEYAVLDSF